MTTPASPATPSAKRLAEDAAPRELTLGTAGHIDHGKTALVAALTGTDTDRLAEERRRGISIELGFARLELPGGSMGVVDVPGHRRLVKAMVSGASGVDMFLLVIAADDGVMPQTREHWTALRALGITSGVIALNKCDVAEPESLEIAREEAGALAPGIPIVEVSARTGAGLDELRSALGRAAGDAAARRPEGGWSANEPILHLDRVFTLKGIGTVVTGTLHGGAIPVGARLRALPSERILRVRGIQVHDEPVEEAVAGQRCALNLVGVGPKEIERGDVLTAERSDMAPSYRLDVQLGFDPDPGTGMRRVQVHHGTRAASGRLVPLERGRLAQLRLESPLIAMAGDRFVIRRIAPPDTLGGGVVIDPRPARHGPSAAAQLQEALEGEPEAILLAAIGAVRGGLDADPGRWEAVSLLGFALHRFPPDRWRAAVASLLDSGAAELHRGRLQLPDTPGPPAPAAPEPLGAIAVGVLAGLEDAGLQPPGPAELAASLGVARHAIESSLKELAGAGRIVRLRGDVSYPQERLARIGELVAELARESGSIGLAELRDALRISRKYSQAILEHLDSTGVTVRHGDRHVLRRPLG